MQFNSAIFFIFLCFLSSHANALSCRKPIQFVIKCEGGICSEGFFAERRLSGNWCKSLLDVHGDEKIYKFDGNLGSLMKSESEILDGFYSIKAYERMRFDKELKSLQCFEKDDSSQIRLKCFDNRAEFTKLDFQSSTSLQEVILDFVAQSKSEALVNEALHWLLPLVIGILILFTIRGWRGQHHLKLNLILFFVSFYGFTELPWGRKMWGLGGVVGILYSTTRFAVAAWKRFKLKRRPK